MADPLPSSPFHSSLSAVPPYHVEYIVQWETMISMKAAQITEYSKDIKIMINEVLIRSGHPFHVMV